METKEVATNEIASNPEDLIPQFVLDRVLNQGTSQPASSIHHPPIPHPSQETLPNLPPDQAGRRIVLLGTIATTPALLLLERAPFPTSPPDLARITRTLHTLQNLGANDVYFWYMARSGGPATPAATDPPLHDDLKLNLIYPCTPKHVKKYSPQGTRSVTETPAIYAAHVRPYMARQRDEGRLAWVWNIIAGTSEAESVIYRTAVGADVARGFLLLPDLNWDRKTQTALHLLALVERRDIWSLRDLRKGHVGWLREMRAEILQAATRVYPGVEEDQLKCYVHYQPTYYHFHIHVVHVALEAGATQAVGKAFALDGIISQLDSMAGDDEAGMHSVDLTYNVGEASELWIDVFEPLKPRRDTASLSQ